MTLAITPNQSAVLTVLRNFIIGLPLNYSANNQNVIEVVFGQDNRVPEPQGPDFVVMTPIRMERIETNIDMYVTGTIGGGPNSYMQPTKFTIQLDVHGPNSADNSQLISTLFRDQYAVDSFAASGTAPGLYGVYPLLADDPRQSPFQNAESQYEYRWIIEAQIQANQIVTAVPQQSAIALIVDLINVEAAVSPTPPPLPPIYLSDDQGNLLTTDTGEVLIP